MPPRIFSTPPTRPGHSALRQYHIRVSQSPELGSAYGTNLLSRLAIAPPLILELTVTNAQGEEIDAGDEMPFLVCHCSLVTDSGQPADLMSPLASSSLVQDQKREQRETHEPAAEPASTKEVPSSASSSATSAPPIHPSGNRQPGPVRMLYGTLVASPQPFQGPDGRTRTYFLFPEISVRARGRFRLKLSLMRIPIPSAPMGSSTFLSTVSTNVFEVVSPDEYIAPHITDLTRFLARQGAGLLLPPGQSAD
ncbi:hypothetical protein IE53DRAFT_342532 [Violaceomyces palustris]|uniref:Uncharacterized protein n=1 Tax=Violaceomyces palustris TaxID=1673888 RepID=A0ACD0NZK2_9BASI|nr:hypothetical protein IE53DRAFT_342532 [Violaceomyces palustris]